METIWKILCTYVYWHNARMNKKSKKYCLLIILGKERASANTLQLGDRQFYLIVIQAGACVLIMAALQSRRRSL